jgi:hypothetical protein
MKLSIIEKPNLDLVVIDDFYTPEELHDVKNELVSIYKFRKRPGQTGDAMNGFEHQKTGTGVFLHELYYDANESSIVNYNQKIFTHQYLDELIDRSVHYKHIRNSTVDTVLVNYYNDNEMYNQHTDLSLFTVIILLGLGDFSGGGMYFKDIDQEIDFKENRAIIFPGCAIHQSRPVQGNGTRVSIAQFINYAAN